MAAAWPGPFTSTSSVLQVCKFLIQLSMDFSSYYNRVHVLGVSRMAPAGCWEGCSPVVMPRVGTKLRGGCAGSRLLGASSDSPAEPLRDTEAG